MLEALEESLKQELALLEYPSPYWMKPSDGLFDVVIIGAGMAGLVAGFACFKEGISNILLIDASTNGKEGPWDTYARMLTLRSGKHLVGPALGIASLTFQAWYTAQYGQEAFTALYKIPTYEWMNYLRWYRKVLQLPVRNGMKLDSIAPEKGRIRLDLEHGSPIYARKLVLATGRAGFGGLLYPDFVRDLPKESYAHTSDEIDFAALSAKRVAIIGSGASGFDAARVALEVGAKEVEMLVRRETLYRINKGAHTVYPGYWDGYYCLSDQRRWEFMYAAYAHGSSPAPFESLDLVRGYENFKVVRGVDVLRAHSEQEKIVLETGNGKKIFDFLILATGFLIDGSKQPELKKIYPDIRLWGDVKLKREKSYPKEFDRYPYLGPHFQFTGAPYLKHIYCFNYAASFSHGQLSGDIPGISQGAERLAKGIAADFFNEDFAYHKQNLIRYDRQEFSEANYPFFR